MEGNFREPDSPPQPGDQAGCAVIHHGDSASPRNGSFSNINNADEESTGQVQQRPKARPAPGTVKVTEAGPVGEPKETDSGGSRGVLGGVPGGKRQQRETEELGGTHRLYQQRVGFADPG